jgi:hypothetical protein
MVYSRHSYSDQYYGCILKATQKAARKQHYIMFPAPIAFLNEELNAELVMKIKIKKDEEEDNVKFCSLQVPMDNEDKDSNKYLVNINKCDTGTPEEFLIWRLTLNEQMKNHEFCPRHVCGTLFRSIFE